MFGLFRCGTLVPPVTVPSRSAVGAEPCQKLRPLCTGGASVWDSQSLTCEYDFAVECYSTTCYSIQIEVASASGYFRKCPQCREAVVFAPRGGIRVGSFCEKHRLYGRGEDTPHNPLRSKGSDPCFRRKEGCTARLQTCSSPQVKGTSGLTMLLANRSTASLARGFRAPPTGGGET